MTPAGGVPAGEEATQQPVLTPLTGSAIFLVLAVEPGGEPAMRDLLADPAGLQRAVGFRYPAGGLACVAGIGAAAWDRVFGGPRPRRLHPLPEFVEERHQSVSTPGDVLFHIRAEQMFLCFELAAQITARLGDAVAVVDEVHGFEYWDHVELSDDVKPPDSHVAANTITDPDGTERRILRDNMPFGELGKGRFGTYFIGYTSDPAVIEEMLHNMFVGRSLAGHDRILDFSTPVAGSLFVVPTAGFLEDQPPAPGTVRRVERGPSAVETARGSASAA